MMELRLEPAPPDKAEIWKALQILQGIIILINLNCVMHVSQFYLQFQHFSHTRAMGEWKWKAANGSKHFRHSGTRTRNR